MGLRKSFLIESSFPVYGLSLCYLGITYFLHFSANGNCCFSEVEVVKTFSKYIKNLTYFVHKGNTCRCSVIQLCWKICDLMDYSMPGFPILRSLPDLAETHVH